jgi:hypothetical protein
LTFLVPGIRAGTITYQVQAVRSTAIGLEARYVVNFGGRGGATAAVMPATFRTTA